MAHRCSRTKRAAPRPRRTTRAGVSSAEPISEDVQTAIIHTHLEPRKLWRRLTLSARLARHAPAILRHFSKFLSPRRCNVYHGVVSGSGQARQMFLGGNDLPVNWAQSRSFDMPEARFGPIL